MELHESLYALGLRHGREVFDDPDSFRGALDDFLDEDSATTRDINLLVDAVRLGAFSSMTTMIDSGALVAAAIEEAGKRLARDRGSADVAGAQWACALLGFAIGKVSDAEVRRYRTQHATPQPPSQPLPPTQFPAQQPPSAQEPARPMAPTAPLPARPTSPAASQATSEGVVGKRVPGYGPEERISLDAAVRKALDIEVRLGRSASMSHHCDRVATTPQRWPSPATSTRKARSLALSRSLRSRRSSRSVLRPSCSWT